MIKTGNNSIFILNNDGTKAVFDSADLQTKIIKSCLNVGIRDTWLAEDMTMAIEYALHCSSKESPTYTEADINSIVIKVLEQSGFPEVAGSFRKQNKESDLKLTFDDKSIKSLIKKYLDLKGDALEQSVKKVADACCSLKIHEASPILILELAKYYKDKLYPIDSIQVQKNLPPFEPNDQPRQLSFIDMISPKNVVLFEKSIIEFYGISQFFSAIKIDFNLYQFVKHMKLDLPLTEMAVVSTFTVLANALNELLDVLYKTYNNIESLPIFLRVVDIHSFAKECLESEWPECESVCHDLMETLQGYLSQKIYKVTFL